MPAMALSRDRRINNHLESSELSSSEPHFLPVHTTNNDKYSSYLDVVVCTDGILITNKDKSTRFISDMIKTAYYHSPSRIFISLKMNDTMTYWTICNIT